MAQKPKSKWILLLEARALKIMEIRKAYVKDPGQYRRQRTQVEVDAKIDAAIDKRERRAMVNFKRAAAGGIQLLNK